MNQPPPTVRLRVPTDEDALARHRVFADRDVMEFHGGAPAELSVYEELTARRRRHDAEHGFCLWTLLDDDGAVIGFTGAQPWPHESFGPVGEIEIGRRLGRSTGAAATRWWTPATNGPSRSPGARHEACGDLPGRGVASDRRLLPARPLTRLVKRPA